MKYLILVIVLVLSQCLLGLTVADAQEADLITEGFADFESNVTLGSIVSLRSATTEELGQIEASAQRGLTNARRAVEQNPTSAEAYYLLGSWLLYGFRVVRTERLSMDPETGAQTEVVTTVVPGLSDDPSEGLAALARSTELAPDNGDYLLDYAAALIDYEDFTRADGMLKSVWADETKFEIPQRMRAGALLSAISEARGELAAAREWIYTSLALDPELGLAVERLRHLDAMQAAHNQAVLEAAIAQAYLEAYAEYEEPYYEEYQEEYPESEHVEPYEMELEQYDDDYWYGEDEEWHDESYDYYIEELPSEGSEEQAPEPDM